MRCGKAMTSLANFSRSALISAMDDDDNSSSREDAKAKIGTIAQPTYFIQHHIFPASPLNARY